MNKDLLFAESHEWIKKAEDGDVPLGLSQHALELIENYTPSKDAVPTKVITLGDTSKKEIALTFDDGGKDLETIIGILDKKEIKASFFLMAGELTRNPDFWRQAVANGHQVLNHTVNHNIDLHRQKSSYIYKEIMTWESIAAEVLGEDYLARMKRDFPIFRTPYGGESDNLHKILGDLGYPITACWSCEDCYLAKHNPDNISFPDHYVSCAKNGAIFLMHPGKGHEKYLEEIIDRIHDKGFEFKLLSEMIEFP